MKTPDQMAKEFSRFDAVTDVGTDLGSYRQGLFEGYIAGYKAAQESNSLEKPDGWIPVKDKLSKEDK